MGQRVGAFWAQAVEDDGEVSLPQVGRGIRQVAGDVVRRAHQQDDVRAGDVGPHGPLLASAFDEGMHGLEHLRADPGDLRIQLASFLQERQVALLSLMRGDGEELQQCRAWIRRFQQPFADRAERVDPVEDDRGKQVILCGEVAEHGALPNACPAGQVQVRIAAASINPADVRLSSGDFRDVVPLEFPHVPGNDFAGPVSEVGARVTAYHVGDEIFGQAVPRALPTIGLTARALMATASVKPGETVLVVGATGGVGTAVVPLLAAARARVIATATAADAGIL